ncbi:polyadenylation factor subunit 2, putative [Plasmodium vinckei]|uniref:Polyadenylation factor subunit 2, putative n=1 Tax=Plasmodium vinckei TaxID=5860 RepID=A0A6V7TGR5_PLAVN|nr:polyadenylation factor subunit 2, putative [Plasmodium vinckei]
MFNDEQYASSYYPTKLGIDRPAVDFNSSICNFLKSDIYKRKFERRLYVNHPIYLRRIKPLFCYSNMIDRFDGVLSHLAFSCLNKSKGAIASLKWFNDGKRLLTGTQLSELAIWNGVYFNFEDMKRIPIGGGAVSCLEWSKNDNVFAGNSLGQIVILSSALNLLDNYAFEGLTKCVLDISLSCCNTKLAGCSDTCDPMIWDIKTRKVIKSLKCKNIDTNNTSCLSWNPINDIVASGNRTQTISLWDIRVTKPIISINAHKANVNKVKWNYNGIYLLSCSKDSLIKLWDIRNFKLLHSYKNDNIINTTSTTTTSRFTANYEPTYITWNPIQNHVFASSDNKGNIKFYNTNDNRCTQTISYAHGIDKPCSITLLDWNPFGHLLTSFGDDKLLKFWSASSCDAIISKEIDAKQLTSIYNGGTFPNSRYVNDENMLDVSSNQSIKDSDEENYTKNTLNDNFYKKINKKRRKGKRKHTSNINLKKTE